MNGDAHSEGTTRESDHDGIARMRLIAPVTDVHNITHHRQCLIQFLKDKQVTPEVLTVHMDHQQ